MNNELFPSDYDAGQLQLRADRMKLTYAYANERAAWYVRLWRAIAGWVR